MWIYEDANSILYFVSENFSYQPNVAIFAMNSTLIQDAINKDKKDTMQLNSNVLSYLKQINESGSIVIIESGYKISKDNLKLITKKFFDLIDNENNKIPFIIMFPLKNNKFQKPYTHIFLKLQQLYESKDSEIVLEKSIMIGSAAGRLSTQNFKADIYDSDRAFASNIGINFKTSDQFFNTSNPRQWNWKFNVIQKILSDQKILFEPSFDNIFKDHDGESHVIFITGPPTSGKTLMSSRVKSYVKNAIVYDINNFTDHNQMILIIKEADKKDQNIIIVDTMESYKKRADYFAILDVDQIIYIEMDASRDLCKFLNLFKLQITKNIVEATPGYAYANYWKFYRPLSAEHKKNIETYVRFPLILRERKELFYHF